jgi:hypothetical protein
MIFYELRLKTRQSYEIPAHYMEIMYLFEQPDEQKRSSANSIMYRLGIVADTMDTTH